MKQQLATAQALRDEATFDRKAGDLDDAVDKIAEAADWNDPQLLQYVNSLL